MPLPPAHLHQERHIELVSDTQERFVVTSTMVSATIPDQLPHLLIFVLKINDRADPKDDSFERVARISDLTTLPHGRDAGLASGTGVGIEFLQSTCVVSYDNLTDAITGATAIKDRVNALITDWINFRTNFNAPDPTPADIPLPTNDPSQKQALINAYATAKQARYAQQQVKTAADAAVTTATNDVTDLSAQVTAVQGFLASATVVKNDLLAESAAFTTLKNAGGVFLAAAGCAPGPDQTTFQSALNAAANQQTLNTGYNTDANNLVSSINTYLSTLNSSLSAAQTALSTAQANQITQSQTLTSDLATEAAALAALLAVAPDFDPSIVPFVPG